MDMLNIVNGEIQIKTIRNYYIPIRMDQIKNQEFENTKF